MVPLTFMLWSVSRIPAFRALLGQGAGEARALIDAMLAEAGTRPDLTGQVKALNAMRPTCS